MGFLVWRWGREVNDPLPCVRIERFQSAAQEYYFPSSCLIYSFVGAFCAFLNFSIPQFTLEFYLNSTQTKSAMILWGIGYMLCKLQDATAVLEMNSHVAFAQFALLSA